MPLLVNVQLGGTAQVVPTWPSPPPQPIRPISQTVPVHWPITQVGSAGQVLTVPLEQTTQWTVTLESIVCSQDWPPQKEIVMQDIIAMPVVPARTPQEMCVWQGTTVRQGQEPPHLVLQEPCLILSGIPTPVTVCSVHQVIKREKERKKELNRERKKKGNKEWIGIEKGKETLWLRIKKKRRKDS